MNEQPYRIKDCYTCTTVNNDTSIITSSEKAEILKSEIATEILKRISQFPLSKNDIIQECLDSFSIAEIIICIKSLEEQGFITNEHFFSAAESAFWEDKGYDLQKIHTILKTTNISVISFDKESEVVFLEACKSIGITVSKFADLQIVIVTDYLDYRLNQINKDLIRDKQNTLLLKINGIKSIIGPLFIPQKSESACWKCLEHRQSLHHHEIQILKALTTEKTDLQRPISSNLLLRQIAANMAIFEIIDYLYHGQNKRIFNSVICYDNRTNETKKHRLIKRPQCATCGNPELLNSLPEPISLNKNSIIINNEGGYRTVCAEDTFQQYSHHISDITGIMPHVRPYHSENNSLIFNYESGRNVALQSNSLFWLNQHLRSGNGGKGKSDVQAKVGAMCEAFERYCMMYHGQRNCISSSHKLLNNAIHPNDCMLFSDYQIENRTLINETNPKFYTLIPCRFDVDEIMEWTPVYSLNSDNVKYLPSSFCFAQYPSKDEQNLYSYPDSNGCAAGNTIEEAILQGFLELVERDAAAIWWYNMLQYPSVDLDSTKNAYITEIIHYYKLINRGIHVLDISTDLAIPVFVAISFNIADGSEILYSFGSHIDASIALERAIIEMNQLLPIIKNSENKYLTKDTIFIEWLKSTTLINCTYLNPSQAKQKNITTDYTTFKTTSLYDSICYCVKSAQNAGIEIFALNLTQPDIGIPVVKVIGPGLRHFWRRTAPGRLYNVPVKMGLRVKPLLESELNHLSIFI